MKKLRRDNKTGITGVHWEKKTEKYYVQISIDNKVIFIGRYEEFEEAVIARYKAEKKFRPDIRATTASQYVKNHALVMRSHFHES